MRAFNFFISLCLLLIGQTCYVSAEQQQGGNSGFRVLEIGNVAPQCSITVNQCYFVMAVNADAELAYVIADDVEEDDTESLPATRYDFLAHSFAAPACLSYASLLRHPSNCFKAPPIIVGQKIDRCILQGVFRI